MLHHTLTNTLLSVPSDQWWTHLPAGANVTKILFGVLSFIAIFSALFVIFGKNPVYNVLYLIICFFAIAGHYVLLNAQFLAAVHVIVYAGAIMVLFLYVIMMLNLNKDTEPNHSVWVKGFAVAAGGMLMVVFVGALKGAATVIPHNYHNPNLPQGFDPSIGLTDRLGQTLFGEFLVPFEVSSVLFLAAMVGAVMIGKKNIQ